MKPIIRAVAQMMKRDKLKKYPGGVESAGAAQMLQKGMKKGRRPRAKDAPSSLSRLDDSARQEFARRNLK
jgi:hypothetical protein